MKLATIETIAEVSNHRNADRLDLVKVLGWQSIVKRGDFKAGDRCVFVVIDTILPDTPWSLFLKDSKRPDAVIRLKTIKLRGEYSQGLVLPLSVLPEHMQTWQVGCDVGAELGIKKYEKELPMSLSGQVKGNFPQYLVSKTDEDNGLSNPWIVEEVVARGNLIITQKLDGSSCTVIVKDGKISEVCSRNLSLTETEGNAFWHAAKKLDVSGFSGDGIIQAELMGHGVQGNQLGLNEPTLFVFQMRWGASAWFERMHIEQYCSHMGCNPVPLVCKDSKHTTLEQFQQLSDAMLLPNGKPAEGIVVRNDPPITSGIGRPLGFKIINRNYID